MTLENNGHTKILIAICGFAVGYMFHNFTQEPQQVPFLIPQTQTYSGYLEDDVKKMKLTMGQLKGDLEYLQKKFTAVLDATSPKGEIILPNPEMHVGLGVKTKIGSIGSDSIFVTYQDARIIDGNLFAILKLTRNDSEISEAVLLTNTLRYPERDRYAGDTISMFEDETAGIFSFKVTVKSIRSTKELGRNAIDGENAISLSIEAFGAATTSLPSN